MLDVQNLSKIGGKKSLLTDLTFRLDAGNRLGILGRNGSGKTLLIEILATLVRPTSGKIEINGVDVYSNLDKIRPLISIFPDVGRTSVASISIRRVFPDPFLPSMPSRLPASKRKVRSVSNDFFPPILERF
jgi:ABC-type multidrug transport system ATPase subunit